MSTLRYPASARVTVYPFTRQGEGEERVIGRPDTDTFLALPCEAIEILDDLKNGSTVGEAQELYHERYGERPDLEDLLTVLEQKGFVQLAGGGAPATWETPATAETSTRKYHLTSFPRSLARALFGPVALAISGLLVVLAIVAALIEPSIWPARDALYFEESMTLKMFILSVFTLGVVFLHELGHLIAVRATGVDSRLGLGNRLWMLVVETDMTGLWAVPRKLRYLPVMAGPIVDATSASVLLLIVFGDRRGWFSLGAFAEDVFAGAILIYLLGLIWQCFFFVRTDFYYVFSTYFDCKNLLRDTEVFLRNQLARVVPGMKPIDQSGIPKKELQVIRGYSVVWFLGRVLALWVLFTIVIPMLGLYAGSIGGAFSSGYSANPYRYLDALIITVFGLIPLLMGMWMWMSGLVQQWRKAT